MTLRLRLTLALGVLLVVGLAIFGVATTGTYARSQYDRLDDQLQAGVRFVEFELYQEAGLAADRPEPDGDAGSGGGGGRTPPVVVPPGTYGELFDASGTSLAVLTTGPTDTLPDVPDPLPASGTIVTVGSVDGGTRWRLLTTASGPRHDETVVMAIPTNDVADSVRRLVTIELAGGVTLLVLLCGGAWYILRRGLRPLETMAASARRISEGDLTHRVEAGDADTEVDELGRALNTMLDGIEEAFAERDATEQRLRQFLADASHELRTPLTSIKGFTELARLEADRAGGDGGPGAAPLDQAVMMRRIEQEADRMRLLVDDLLLLARLDQTRPIERTSVDLAVIAADACTGAAAADRTRTITLDAPAPVVVPGDDAHLRQAVGNLVANALRHTPAGTPVDVAVRLDGATARVVVADRGPGLDADALAHAFDRFWQADAARTGRGAGLGLAIVAAIAAEHHGTARAANRDGGGAEFTLELPVATTG